MLSVVGFFGREFDSPRLHHFLSNQVKTQAQKSVRSRVHFYSLAPVIDNSSMKRSRR